MDSQHEQERTIVIHLFIIMLTEQEEVRLIALWQRSHINQNIDKLMNKLSVCPSTSLSI